MKRSIVFILLLSIIISALWSDELFSNQYHLEQYLFPYDVNTVIPRQVADLSDSSFIILAELELSVGMLADYAVMMMHINADGSLGWFRLLTDNPSLSNMGIVEQGWHFSRCMEVNDNDEVIVSGCQNEGNWDTIIAKYNAQGEQLSAMTFPPSSGIQKIKAFKKGQDSTYYIIGENNFGGGNEAFIGEVDAQGDTLWTTHIDEYNEVYDMEVINGHKLLMTVSKTVPGPLAHTLYCVCYDFDSRNVIWEQILDESCAFERSVCISSVSNGKYYLSYEGVSYPDVVFYIKSITENGSYLEEYEISFSALAPINVVPVGDDFICATGNSNANLFYLNQSGSIDWTLFFETDGFGAEIMIPTSDGNFVMVSNPDEDSIILTKFDADGNFTHTNEEVVPVSNYNLKVYPNPMNYGVKQRGLSWISFDLNTLDYQDYCIEVYSIKGELLYHNEITNPKCGLNTIQWYGNDSNGSLLSSGVYLCCLKGNKNVIATTRTVILK